MTFPFKLSCVEVFSSSDLLTLTLLPLLDSEFKRFNEVPRIIDDCHARSVLIVHNSIAVILKPMKSISWKEPRVIEINPYLF